MAKAGDEIFNPRTGQRMVFLKTAAETNGELLQIECFHAPSGPKEPEHVHPQQESRFEVLGGTVNFSIQGKEQTLKAGEALTIPADIPHYFWNGADEEAHYIQEFRPALRIDAFFELLFGLAQDGKLDHRGMPGFLDVAAFVPVFSNEIRVTRPPWVLQKVLFGLLSPIARLLGHGPPGPTGSGGP
jgi:quercetin dioxygenase-like cupin family protein